MLCWHRGGKKPSPWKGEGWVRVNLAERQCQSQLFTRLNLGG